MNLQVHNIERFASMRRQRGVTTLIIAILLLGIMTISVLFSVNVGYFEQRTATLENRSKLAHQAAESALTLGSEFLKANAERLVSKAADGWLDPADPRWQPCDTIFTIPDQTDPCLAEPDLARRMRLYRFAYAGTTAMDYEAAVPVAAHITIVGNGFPVTTRVTGLLCRLDTSDPSAASCALSPGESRLFTIMLLATGNLAGESATAEVKQTLGTFRSIAVAANIPLIASGVTDLGKGQIVANPKTADVGAAASIWAPTSVDAGAKPSAESYFFPSHRKVDGMQLDQQADSLDDSLFEWVFNKDVVDGTGVANTKQAAVRTDCGPASNQDCAQVALRNLGAREISSCANLNATSRGMYWLSSGTCELSGTIGSPTRPVVLVIEGSTSVPDAAVFFGMLFLRSSNNAAEFGGDGNFEIFGSVVVEGNVKLTGSPHLVYSQEVTDAINDSPDFNGFGKVPGTWLDAHDAF